MVEFTIVLAFAVLVLVMGPGGNVIAELFMVSKESHRGYTYSLSMSPMPDFRSAADYEKELAAQDYSSTLIERLAVEEDELYDALEPYNDRFDEINKINKAFDALASPPSFKDLKKEAIDTLKDSLF